MIEKRRTPDMNVLMHRPSVTNPMLNECSLSETQLRAVMAEVDIGDPIMAASTGQQGIVAGIIRDRHGVPVCYKVKYIDSDSDSWLFRPPAEDAEWGYDYIAVDRVSWCRQIEDWCYEREHWYYNEEEQQEEDEWYIKAYNLTWSEEDGVYYDPDGEACFW